MLQKIVQTGRKVIPRGWSPFLRFVAKFHPDAEMYPASLENGETFFLDLSEEMCHGYFYNGGIGHERYTVALFKKFLQPGDAFIDVGANVGYFTRLAGKLVGQEGTVHAFEPMAKANRLLKENVSDLQCVTLHDVAVSNEEGVGSFSIRKKGDRSSLMASSSVEKQIQVQLDTLDNTLKGEDRVDMIKIDVEGHELEVLQGAMTIIKEHRPLLYFEHLSQYAGSRGLSIGDYASLLNEHGYTLSWINPDYPQGELTTNDYSRASYIIGQPADARRGPRLKEFVS